MSGKLENQTIEERGYGSSAKEHGLTCPLVTVVIVTWERRQDVLEAIQSVYEQSYWNTEVVVVDNGSTDGTVEAVRHAFPRTKVVALDHNIGVASGRNAGIDRANGAIVVFLDSDASLGEGAIAHLVHKFHEKPDVGVINSKIVSAYTGEVDGGPGWVYSEKQKACQDAEFLSWSFSEGGAAIRKDVFDRVGLFWERLFFGCEGQELSLRVWDAGYRVIYYPKAVVFHRASPKSRVAEGERDSQFLRNSLYIYVVRYPWWVLVWYAPLKVVAALIRGVRRRYLRQIVRVLFDVARQLPVLREERRPISDATARFYLGLQRQHGPLSWDLASWLKYKS
jgi:GT2 family glycosyltransferase